MTVVLDASALLAMLLGEPGDKVVQAAIPDSAMCTVNLSEVVGHLARCGSSEVDIRPILDPLPIGMVPFDNDLAYAAGLLLPRTRSARLSLGNRACLALARRSGSKVLTADRAGSTIESAVGVGIEVIR